MEKRKECGQITRYNGWENHATWLAQLWLSNDEGSWRYSKEKAEAAWEEAEEPPKYLSRYESARIKLAGELKDAMEENNPLAENCDLYSDLLSAALSDVNWQEVAAAFLKGHVCPDCLNSGPGEISGYSHACGYHD